MKDTVDIGRIRARARALSKALLGAQFRAEIAAFIADGEPPFWARGMAQQLDIPENKVATELSRFAASNLLVAMPVEQWDRRKLYERTSANTEYWRLGRELVERAAADEAARAGVDAATAMRTYLETVHPSAGWGSLERRP